MAKREGFIAYFWDHYKALRRGEVRITPRGQTLGRCYAKINPEDEATYQMKSKPIVTLTGRIIRADGTIEDLGVMSQRELTKEEAEQLEGMRQEKQE